MHIKFHRTNCPNAQFHSPNTFILAAPSLMFFLTKRKALSVTVNTLLKSMKTTSTTSRQPMCEQLARSLYRSNTIGSSLGAAVLAFGIFSLPNASAQTSETFNTVGTTSWVCPPGVTSVQAECWGGGGAGGAANNTSTATTGTINVGGGGGAGGSYARGNSIPVTPGMAYDIIIPPAATAPAGTADGIRFNGGNVSFTGDSSMMVVAVGGQGGQSKVASTNITGGGGVGSTTGCIGDVVFAGGSSTVSGGAAGGGGGGAGNANAGSSTANNVGGLGGSTGGGKGGTGPTGSNVGNSGGAPVIAGGGGSGSRMQRLNGTARAGGAGALGQIILTYTAPSTGKLVITSLSGTATAGSDFSVTVEAQDSGGSPLNATQDTTITLSNSGNGTISGNTATILSGTSSATLSAVQYTKAEAITLIASRTSGDQLEPSIASSSITVSPAAASKIAFTTEPSASTAFSIPFATQPVVAIQDAFGNLITSGGDETATITMTLTTGTGTLGGTTSMNAVAGVADFAGMGLNIDQGGANKVLTATSTFGTAVSAAFTITGSSLTWLDSPATHNWTTASEVNWSGGTGIFTSPGSANVTFDETGSDVLPINLVGSLEPISVTVDSTTKNYIFDSSSSGIISGATGLVKRGNSTLTLLTANDYSGITDVIAGTVVMGHPAALGNNNPTLPGQAKVRFPAGSTGTLQISTNGSDTPYSIGTNSSTVDLVNDTWGTDCTIASDLSTPGAGINHAMGNLNLALARLNIVAGPYVSSGTPKVTFSTMVVTSGSTNPPAKINPTTASVSIGDVSTLNGTAKTLILGGTSVDNEITGAITAPVGTLALTKNNSSTWTISGANTYTGVTTVSDGSLVNGSASTFANTGALTVNGTGILDLNGNNAVFTSVNVGANTGTITNSSATAVTLTASAQAGTTISSLITGNMGLRIANTNSSTPFLALANANTFTGGITLMHGSGVGSRLRINAVITGTPFGTGPITLGEASSDKAGIMIDTVANTISNDIIFNTALGSDIPGIRLQANDTVLSGEITANLASATFSQGAANTGNATLTGKITGDFGLDMTPAAASTTPVLRLTLNNAAMTNDYLGDTTVGKVSSSVFTLALGSSNQIPNGTGKGNVVINGALDLNGFSETINGLYGTGTVDSIAGGAPVLTVGDNDATSNFDGVIQDTAGKLALTKIGAGTLTLNGINTYTGDTTVNGGILAVNGNSIADTNILNINGGKVEVTGNETVALLFYGAVAKADGVYGSSLSSAPPANQDDTRFSGTGTVTVDSTLAPSGFSGWLASGGFANDALLVGKDGPNDDPDNDGISNLIEYALADLDPTASNAAAGSLSGLLVTYTKRPLAVSNGDITYAIEKSNDLGLSTPWTTVTPTTDNTSIISYMLTPPAPSKDFVRLKITQP